MSTLSTQFLDLQTALAGEYSLERELGRGGMGVVYLARDVQLDHATYGMLTVFAILTFLPDVMQLSREARAAASRIDLLRLRAGASDLAPLTTSLDAARLLSDDLKRLAAAQQQVAIVSAPRPLGAGRIPTPS